MANSDRAFRALARSQPEVITALLQAVAPRLVRPGMQLDPADLAPTQLDALPPDLDADFVTRVGQKDLLHVECQGYKDGKFEERAVWYHVGFALRHRGKRRVRTVAFWLVRPPRTYPKGRLFRVHDITVKVTSIVLEDVGASVLLADPRTACLAAGAEAEGRTKEELCVEVARVLAANNATSELLKNPPVAGLQIRFAGRRYSGLNGRQPVFALAPWPARVSLASSVRLFSELFAERHMAAVAAMMRGRYDEMVMAMQAANLGPVIIEDLVKYGEDLGLAKGLEQGVRASLRQVLEARKIVLTPKQKQRIESCTDLPTLQHWLKRAVTARTASEALR